MKFKDTIAAEALYRTAHKLGNRLDTDWAYEHEDEYNALMDTLEALYDSGVMTGAEFNEIAGIAFYDFEPKDVDAEDDVEE